MRKTTAQLKTAEQVKDEFKAAGITVSAWARAHKFDRMAVVDVLRGKRVGRYGEAHAVAVALGIKAGVVVDAKTFKPLKKAA